MNNLPRPATSVESSRHLAIFTALCLPFEPWEVRTLPKGKGMLYITARTAMNRLDEVLGPENWWDDYTPGENSVLCRLTIRLPDGSTITKADAGGYAGMADSGDDDKSGYSDAFKRAAVKFGVSRYLYQDGVPAFAREAFTAEEVRLAKGDPKRPRTEPPEPAAKHPASQWPPTDGRHLYAWLKSESETSGLDVLSWVKDWAHGQKYPVVINRWTPAQVRAGHAEAKRLIADSLSPSDLAEAHNVA